MKISHIYDVKRNIFPVIRATADEKCRLIFRPGRLCFAFEVFMAQYNQPHKENVSQLLQNIADNLSAQLSRKTISDEFRKALTYVLKPMAEQVCLSVGEIEKLKRKEYLTPEEVEKVYGLRASTLANKRSKAQGPEYTKAGEKILYGHQDIKKYLDARRVRTQA